MLRPVISFDRFKTRSKPPEGGDEALRFVDALATDGATETNDQAELAETWAMLGLLTPEDVDGLKAQTPQYASVWRSPTAWGAVAASLIVALGGLYLYERPAVYQTEVGELRKIELSDGSQITLNTDSRLEVKLRGNRRFARLTRGEAFFAVAKRPDHVGFEVATQAALISVKGTHFNIDLHKGGTEVDLLEGRVVVLPTKGSRPVAVSLFAGQAVRVSALGGVNYMSASGARIDDWMHRRLNFVDCSLGEAVAEMNRYSRIPIRLQDETLKTFKVNGVFEVGDTRAFSQALSALYGLEVETRDDAFVIKRAPSV